MSRRGIPVFPRVGFYRGYESIGNIYRYYVPVFSVSVRVVGSITKEPARCTRGLKNTGLGWRESSAHREMSERDVVVCGSGVVYTLIISSPRAGFFSLLRTSHSGSRSGKFFPVEGA